MKMFEGDGVRTGGSANPGANQGGATEPADDSDSDPFAGIDLNDLDPEARKVIEAGQKKFATLQTQNKAAKAAQAKADRDAHQFKQQHDKLFAQLQQVTQGRQADDPKSQLVERFQKTLEKNGVSPEQAKLQAPLMLDLMQQYGETLKGQIGRDFAPLAGTVLHNEATRAFQESQQNDRFGALQIPEVAEAVWSSVQTMINAGQNVDTATVTNLRNMMYMQHLEHTNATGVPAMQVQNPPPLPLPGYGMRNYPGSGQVAQRPTVTDANAPRYTLDAAGQAAMKAVVSNWDVKPKAFQTGGRK